MLGHKKKGMLSRKEDDYSVINTFSVGFEAMKQSSAEPPSGFEVFIKIPDTAILQQSLSCGKKPIKPNCKHPKKCS